MSFFAWLPSGIAQSADSLLQEQADWSTAEQLADESFDPLEELARNPWNIQTVQPAELQRLYWLTPQQVQAFFLYRERLKGFQSIYELQAIPAWDLSTIRQTLPFLRFEAQRKPIHLLADNSWQELLLRWTQSNTGYHSNASGATSSLLGPAFRSLIRYKLKLNPCWQGGLLAENDPGEPFFKRNKGGFDFYTGHLQYNGNRFIKKLLIGDYAVNMGQGLIGWQGFSMSPSFDPVSIYKQGPVLSPHRGADEYNFLRGIACTMGSKKWEWSVLASRRKLDAYTDSLQQQEVITSIKTDGYHNTESAATKKGNLLLINYGMVFSLQHKKGRVGLNLLHNELNKPWEPATDWYRLNHKYGKAWWNMSIDWTYIYKNACFFGEFGASIQGKAIKKTGLAGLLLSVSRQTSFRFFVRSLQSGYQSLFANSMAQQAQSENETGLLAGLSCQFHPKWRLETWGDVYANQWIKSNKFSIEPDAIWQIRLLHNLSKTEWLSVAAVMRQKQLNRSAEEVLPSGYFRATDPVHTIHMRLQYFKKLTARTQCNVRLEWSGWKSGIQKESLLGFIDVKSKINNGLTIQSRLSTFSGNEYDARIYAFEPDLTYTNRINVFYQSSLDLLLLCKWKLNHHWQADIRIKYTKYIDNQIINNELPDNPKRFRTDMGAQIIYQF
jgi:hypothetical protein